MLKKTKINSSSDQAQTLLDQKKANIEECLRTINKKNPPASIKECVNALTELRENNEEALKKFVKKAADILSVA